MKNASMTLLATVISLTPSLAAANEDFSVSGSVRALSNYLWRGITLSDDKPSLQGDITLYHSSGFYVGGSFETYRNAMAPEGMNKDYEVDYYAGLYRSVTEDLALGFTVQHYTYGEADSSTEYTATADYGNTNFNVSYDQDLETLYADLNYTIETNRFGAFTLHGGYFFDGEIYWYMDGNEVAKRFYDVSLGYSYWLFEQLELSAVASYQEFEDDNYMVGLAYYF